MDNLVMLRGGFSPEIISAIKRELPNGFELIHDSGSQSIKGVAYFIIGGGALLSAADIEAAKSLRLIQKWGIGVDKIDLAAAAKKGIPVAITAGANSDVVAEHAILLMLALYKHLPLIHNSIRAGEWLRTEMRSVSYMIKGKTAGIVGLGNIGKQVAQRLNAFGAAVRYYDIKRPSPEGEQQLKVEFRALDELLSTSDIVTLHVPLTPETCGMINSEKLSMMSPSAIIINTARGGVIDETALAEALQRGRLWGAGLDVFSVEPPRGNPLLQLENVVLTPHVGGAAVEAVAKVARHCFRNIKLVDQGLPLASDDLIEFAG